MKANRWGTPDEVRAGLTGLAVAAVIMVALCQTASAQVVRMAGSGANVGAINLLIGEFRKQQPAAQFAPVEAVGSGGAIKAVAAGALHIALVSRALKPEERASGVREIVYARTPFVVAVRADSQVRNVSAAQLAEYFSGMLEAGPDGVRVRPVLRPANDVDTELLKQLSPKLSLVLEQALGRPGMLVAATDKEAADLIERTVGSIGTTTLGLIQAESRKLRALPVEGKAPTLAALESGAYPFHKTLFLVVSEKAELPADARKFVEFVSSAPARALLKRTGHVLPPFAGA